MADETKTKSKPGEPWSKAGAQKETRWVESPRVPGAAVCINADGDTVCATDEERDMAQASLVRHLKAQAKDAGALETDEERDDLKAALDAAQTEHATVSPVPGPPPAPLPPKDAKPEKK